MNKVSFLIITGLVTITLACQPKQTETTKTEATVEPAIDSSLIKKLKADEYGMKHYVIAILKRGPNRSKDSIEAAKLQKAHLENIMRLAEEGKLVIAGPFMDDIDDVRGIYIFDVETIEEARKLTETDPAIQAGSLVMELKPWYGSAAIMLVPEIHKKLEKKNIAE